MVWFVVNEIQGEQESLNHYRIITNIADQNALQEQPHNNHKVDFLERQCNSAMKNCLALSNVEHEQILSFSLKLVVYLLVQMKTVENHCGKSKSRPVQIRHTLLDAEGMNSRVNTESIQYEFMMVVISSVKMEVGKKKMASH